MKTVTRIDSLNEQERTEAQKEQQRLFQESAGIIKQDGRYMKELKLMVSAEDIKYLRKYRNELYNNGRFHVKGMDVVYEMLNKRTELDELVISDSTTLSPLHIRVDTELYETLNKESKKLKVTLNDYIRGILYGLGMVAGKRMSAKITEGMEALQRNRHTLIPIHITAETREKFFAKHGRMNDEQLAVLVNKQVVEYLNK